LNQVPDCSIETTPEEEILQLMKVQIQEQLRILRPKAAWHASVWQMAYAYTYQQQQRTGVIHHVVSSQCHAAAIWVKIVLGFKVQISLMILMLMLSFPFRVHHLPLLHITMKSSD
jgi:hypothetical protein